MRSSSDEQRRRQVEVEFLSIMGQRPNHVACQRIYDVLLEGSLTDLKCKVLPDIDPQKIYSALSRYGEAFASAYAKHLSQWNGNDILGTSLPSINQGAFDRFLISYLFVKHFGLPEDYELDERSVYYALREGCCLAGKINLSRDISIQGLNHAIGNVPHIKRFWYTYDLQVKVAQHPQPVSMNEFSRIIANAKQGKTFTQRRSERVPGEEDAFY